MEYLEEVKAYAWKHGYTVTLLGRRREVPLLKSPLPFLRAQGERIAINAPIQGTSADVIKLAMIDADAYIKEKNLQDKVKLSLQIHDELVFELDADIAESVADDLVVVLENVLKKRNLSNLPLVASRSLGANLQAL
jgi:DNA polymerase-1